MIKGSLTHGYTSAYKHYKELKNKMLDEFTMRLQFDKKLQTIYQQQQEDMEANILSEVSSHEKSFGSAIEALNTVETLVGDILLNSDVSGLKNLFNDMTSKSLDFSNEIEEQKKQLKLELKQNQNAIFEKLNMNKNFFNQIAASTTSGDVTDIVNQLSSYFIRYLYDSIMNQFQLTARFKYLMSLSGFYKEATEYEVLSKHFGKALNTYHAGSKNTELDIIITSLNNLEKALSGNTEITKLISVGNFTDLSVDLINQIEWFGEQVKSWSLNSKNTEYHIGNRATLFQSFLSEKNVSEAWSTLESAYFLARFENILLALGPANVLFSSNNNRQWMCDFIHDFRQQSYFLVFGRGNNKSPLTDSVKLESYFTEKKQIRKRFLS